MKWPFRQRIQPIRFAIIMTAIAFLILSFFPIWKTWYFNSWEIVGMERSFWELLWMLPDALRKNSVSDLLPFYCSSLVLLNAIIVGGFVLNYLTALAINCLTKMMADSDADQKGVDGEVNTLNR